MPAVNSPGKVLVTGSGGFLAAWIVRDLLARGYHVVGTVRTAKGGEALKNQFLEKEGEKAKRFEYTVVPDLSAVRSAIALLHWSTHRAY